MGKVRFAEQIVTTHSFPLLHNKTISVQTLILIDRTNFIHSELSHYTPHNRHIAFIRELLQNSLDAVARRKREDKDMFQPRIHFSLQLINRREDVQVKLEDNGIGMNAERLLGLNTLGHSDKGKIATQAGGFGAAKVLIYMAQKKYSIISRAYGETTAYQYECKKDCNFWQTARRFPQLASLPVALKSGQRP